LKAKLRSDREAPCRSNKVWAIDFVHEQLASGRKLQILSVVDAYSRFSPVIDPHFSNRGEDVVQTLERVCKDVGYPAAILVD
jgi:putative transposase